MGALEEKVNELSRNVDFLTNDNARTLVLWEEISSQYKAINEGLDNLQSVPARLEQVEVKIDKLDMKMSIIEPIVKGHNSRINRLEHKVFE